MAAVFLCAGCWGCASVVPFGEAGNSAGEKAAEESSILAEPGETAAGEETAEENSISAGPQASLEAGTGEMQPDTETGDGTIQRIEGRRVTEAEISEKALTEQFLSRLTLEEKVAQLFIVLPDSFLGVDGVNTAGEMTRQAIDEIPVGGFIYMAQNLESADQVKAMTAATQEYSMDRTGLPMFLCVDEEGGTVTRISGRGLFDVPEIGDMSEIGAGGSVENAREVGETMGTYLAELGLNLDFAPDADVLSNPQNTVVRQRSFGSDPELVAEMSLAVLEGLGSRGVQGTLKHFPGHGATEGDTHEGYAYTSKSLEELRECELIPFQRGIENGADFIMVGHISLPNVIGDGTPASLSSTAITDILRNEMGYEGIVVTDALNMGAIAGSYSSARASVMALQAGADLLLMPADFRSAYDGVMDAVQSGALSQERIDESVRRILRVKMKYL